MVALFVLALVFSSYYYVQAIHYAMPAKTWALVGFMTGPISLPLFIMKQHVAWRRAIGYNNMLLKA
jgi:hypothetical protein